MDEQKQREFISYLGRRLKDMYHLTVVYRIGLQFAKDYGVPSLDDVLEAAHKAPAVQAEVDRYFADFPELSDKDNQSALEEAAHVWLQEWKSSGKPN